MLSSNSADSYLGESLYVATSLLSWRKPTAVASLWCVAGEPARPGDGHPPARELAYRLTPVLFRAIEQQVDGLAVAFAAGELSLDKATLAAGRWEAIREFARECGWLAPGGAVASVTPAEVEAYQCPPAPCLLRELDWADEAYAWLLARVRRSDEIVAGVVQSLGGESGSEPEAALEPVATPAAATVTAPTVPAKSFPVHYSKPPSKAGAGKASRAKAAKAKKAGPAAPKLFM